MKRFVFVFISFLSSNENFQGLTQKIIEDYQPVSSSWDQTRAEIFQKLSYGEQRVILSNVLPFLPVKTHWDFLLIVDSLYSQKKKAIESNDNLCLAKINLGFTWTISSSRQTEAKKWAKDALLENYKDLLCTILEGILSRSLQAGLINFGTAWVALNRLDEDSRQIFFEYVFKKWPFLKERSDKRFFYHPSYVYIGMIGGLMEKHLKEGKKYSYQQIRSIYWFIEKIKIEPSDPLKDILYNIQHDFLLVILDANKKSKNTLK